MNNQDNTEEFLVSIPCNDLKESGIYFVTSPTKEIIFYIISGEMAKKIFGALPSFISTFFTIPYLLQQKFLVDQHLTKFDNNGVKEYSEADCVTGQQLLEKYDISGQIKTCICTVTNTKDFPVSPTHLFAQQNNQNNNNNTESIHDQQNNNFNKQ